MKRMPVRTLPIAALVLVALASSAAQTDAASAAPIRVLASFSILEDIVGNVGGSRVEVGSLVPRGGDAHTFQPSPADVRRVAEARLVFVNGLGFEGWLTRLTRNAGSARVVTLGGAITPLRLAEHAQEEHGGEDEHGEFDPHAWWNPLNAIAYARRVRDALSNLDPTGASVYRANAERYARQLADLDAYARARFATVPPARRKLVTNHDALGYLAARYGLTVVDTVFPGGSTEREPSAREVAGLIQAIRGARVPAIFTENVVNARLAQAIAHEAGAKVAPPLYTDALGAPGSSGDTYLKAFRHNVDTIVAALR